MRRSKARLRRIRWTIFKRFNEEEVWKSLGYYKSLVKRFLKRLLVKLKPKDLKIWKEKLLRIAQDVEEFLMKKPNSSSTHHVNMLMVSPSQCWRLGMFSMLH